ncbi:Transcriptional repressor PaaX [Streptomyces sp. RB5]|uniref:Transcriptional repressor PaaX n=1 Tax=Streptomyces smaragdinus TaxID=2585196 RepID=A0A7K0CIG5_9ACTN|nr:PaaX family transcriptional regulator C-terminal domain-containing protein [Streptomyces smaragdinus]MQY12802.1 Transcriptional repressor PaaX [Streptomyces smaragdinus]
MAEQRTPRSLIVTFYGTYGRGPGTGPLPVSALIRLLGAVGVDAPAVRSAVSRLKRRGFLVAEGGLYTLSESARVTLEDGDRRIYERPLLKDDGEWLLAVFSVPEQERGKRHLLRSRLARLGFGQASPGVWIAPSHVYEETRHTLVRLGLTSYVELFRGTHEGFTATADAVASWWDLDAVAAMHRVFLAGQEPVLRRWAAADAQPTPEEAYRDYLLAVDAWRQLPYADPGLPSSLLPEDWPGVRAAEVFAALHTRLRARGAEFVVPAP